MTTAIEALMATENYRRIALATLEAFSQGEAAMALSSRHLHLGVTYFGNEGCAVPDVAAQGFADLEDIGDVLRVPEIEERADAIVLRAMARANLLWEAHEEFRLAVYARGLSHLSEAEAREALRKASELEISRRFL